MTTSNVIDKPSRRSRWSWYFYDFGNSAYASVILLAVFSLYFSKTVVQDGSGVFYWNLAVGVAAIIVALISPVLGTIADFSRAKKKFLFIFTVLAVVFTGLLFFVQKGDVIMAVVFFILAEIGYRGAQVFYDSLLVDISTPETIGSVSGKGWAAGMLGGIVCLVLVLIPIMSSNNDPAMVRLAFLITAVFYALCSIPVFLNVKQVNAPEQLLAGESTISHAFKKLGNTFRDVKRYKEFIKYAVSFLIYNDGIMMLMDNAALIAGIIYGFKTDELIVLIIILQVAGAAGSFLFGWISNKYSSKQAITYAIIMLVAVVSFLYITDDKTLFYVIGALVGFSLSGVQAVSRTMVSQLAPQEKTTEFFGFLSVAGRTSTFIGPLVFGTIHEGMKNWYINGGIDPAIAEISSMYWAIGSVIAFLLIGLFILLKVRKVTHKDPIKFD